MLKTDVRARQKRDMPSDPGPKYLYVPGSGHQRVLWRTGWAGWRVFETFRWPEASQHIPCRTTPAVPTHHTLAATLAEVPCLQTHRKPQPQRLFFSHSPDLNIMCQPRRISALSANLAHTHHNATASSAPSNTGPNSSSCAAYAYRL